MHLNLMGREPADVSKHSNNVGMHAHAAGVLKGINKPLGKRNSYMTGFWERVFFWCKTFKHGFVFWNE